MVVCYRTAQAVINQAITHRTSSHGGNELFDSKRPARNSAIKDARQAMRKQRKGNKKIVRKTARKSVKKAVGRSIFRDIFFMGHHLLAMLVDFPKARRKERISGIAKPCKLAGRAPVR